MQGRLPIPSLTGLRFVAAMCVVAAHALLRLVPFPAEQPLWYTYVTQASGPGMTLFFVLSGFVIHYNYSATLERQGAGGLRNFFVARFARLYPLYILCVVVSIAWTWRHGTLGNLVPLPYFLLLAQSWFYVVIGDNAVIYQLGPVLPVTWSISTEWFFYLAYPLVCAALLRIPGWRRKLAAAVAVSAVMLGALFVAHGNAAAISRIAAGVFGPVAETQSHWQDSFLRWLIYFSPYSRLGEFLIGCLAAAIFMDLQQRPVSRREARFGSLGLIAALLGCAALYRAMFGPPYSGPPFTFVTFLHMSFGFAPLIAAVIFCCARYRSWLGRALSLRPVVLCGEASYSIYLLHLFVFHLFVLRAVPVTNGDEELRDLAWMALAIAVTLVVSLVSYALWERPLRNLLRRGLAPRLRKAPA